MPDPQLPEGVLVQSAARFVRKGSGLKDVVLASDLPAIEAKARKEERERLREAVEKIPIVVLVDGDRSWGDYFEDRRAKSFKADVLATLDQKGDKDGPPH